MNKTIIFVCIIVCAITLSGCAGSDIDLSKVSKQDIDKVIVCEKPYMRFASSCCLDKNDNKICDKDEGLAPSTETDGAAQANSPQNIGQQPAAQVAPQVQPPSPLPTPTPTPAPTIGNRVQVDVGNNGFLGEADAKVTIIEFTDFECPFCGRFYTQSLGQLKSDYINTGKVKFYTRNFPLEFHENAQKAAEAAVCAGVQGKFYEMHDKLYDNQFALDVGSLKKYASSVGLDTSKFNTCLDTDATASAITADVSAGKNAGVSGTPSFFIGSPEKGYKFLVGAQPYSSFKAAIDDELVLSGAQLGGTGSASPYMRYSPAKTFAQMFLPNGKWVGTIVYGKDAPVDDVVNGAKLASWVQSISVTGNSANVGALPSAQTGNGVANGQVINVEAANKLDTQIADVAATAGGIVAIGDSCTNRVVAELKGKTYPDCTKEYSDGQSVLEFYTNGNGYIFMVVTGNSASERRNAVSFITQNAAFVYSKPQQLLT